jgi:hypothetical protein
MGFLMLCAASTRPRSLGFADQFGVYRLNTMDDLRKRANT